MAATSKNTLDTSIQPTGIAELDTMLHGGIPRGADVLLAGGSGTGKTILSLQWLFAGYDTYQEPGLYISLTEPIAKTLRNVKKLSFYKEEQVGPLQVYFTDMRGIMEGMDVEHKEMSFEDIDQITSTLKLMVDQSKAKRVVIDSITAMAYLLKDKDKIRDFIFKLGTLLAQTDTTVILISEVLDEGYSVFGTEEFIADGIIKMTPKNTTHGSGVRHLTIVKMRGINYEDRPAMFRITEQGIRLIPPTNRNLHYTVSTERIALGTDGLDQMASGGLFKGSATILNGPSGSGKTILSMQFLNNGLANKENCLMVSFEESQDQIMRVADRLGWDLTPKVQSGQLQLICAYPEEYSLDEHMDRIKQTVEKNKIQRLVVDSLSAVKTVYAKENLTSFNAQIINHLKQQGVTSIFTHASDALLGTESATNAYLSTLYDNIIMLRYVEIESELKHLLLILKMRGTQHDKKLRELIFTPHGVKITSSFIGLEGALTGEARKVSSTAEEQFHSVLVDIMGLSGEKIFMKEKLRGLSMEHIEAILQEFTDQKVISKRQKEQFLESVNANID